MFPKFLRWYEQTRRQTIHSHCHIDDKESEPNLVPFREDETAARAHAVSSDAILENGASHRQLLVRLFQAATAYHPPSQAIVHSAFASFHAQVLVQIDLSRSSGVVAGVIGCALAVCARVIGCEQPCRRRSVDESTRAAAANGAAKRDSFAASGYGIKRAPHGP